MPVVMRGANRPTCCLELGWNPSAGRQTASDCSKLSFAFRSPAMQLDDMTISSLEIWRTAPVGSIKVHAQKFRRTLAQQP